MGRPGNPGYDAERDMAETLMHRHNAIIVRSAKPREATELVAAARDLYVCLGEDLIETTERGEGVVWQQTTTAHERLRRALKPFDEVEV